METAGKVSELAGRALKPAERLLKPAERLLKPAERALESAGRLIEASWEAQSYLGGQAATSGETERNRERKTERTDHSRYVVVP